MTATRPRVSIGLAVYNGEPYLAEAISSLLAQTYSDFELIISDNASTDQTETICRQYAAQDSRIRYSRNPTNIGGANNENQTFLLARGEYFRWAAHDDVCAPELLEKSVVVLDQNPDVVLCYSMITEIDQDGKPIRTVALGKGQSPLPYVRFRELMRHDHNCEPTYGLIRSAILGQTRLQQNYTDSDRTLLCELSLYGRFAEIPNALFYKRYHPKNRYIDMRARMAWFDPARKGRAVFPYWLQFFDLLHTIRRAPISVQERVRCYFSLVEWLRPYAKRMVKDLWVAGQVTLLPTRWQKKREHLYNWE